MSSRTSARDCGCSRARGPSAAQRRRWPARGAAHDEAAAWARRREPLDVERKLRDGDRAMQDAYRAIEAARRKVGDHIEPLLQRREDHAPTIEARLAAVEADLDALRARLDDAGDAPLLRRVK